MQLKGEAPVTTDCVTVKGSPSVFPLYTFGKFKIGVRKRVS